MQPRSGNVWSIRPGMTADEVRAALGPPPETRSDLFEDPSVVPPWWLYPVPGAGVSPGDITWIFFGFDEAGRVAAIEHGHTFGMLDA